MGLLHSTQHAGNKYLLKYIREKRWVEISFWLRKSNRLWSLINTKVLRRYQSFESMT